MKTRTSDIVAPSIIGPLPCGCACRRSAAQRAASFARLAGAAACESAQSSVVPRALRVLRIRAQSPFLLPSVIHQFFSNTDFCFWNGEVHIIYFFFHVAIYFCASPFHSISTTTHPPGCQGKHLGHCMKCERPRPWPCALAFLDWDPRLCPRTGRGSRRFAALAGIKPLLIACLGPGSGSR